MLLKIQRWLEEEDFSHDWTNVKDVIFTITTPKRCKECGCFMMVKARLAGSHCPIRKVVM